MVESHCRDCKYFEPDDMKDEVGSCHRHAPVPGIHEGQSLSPKRFYWPAVWPNDWCGQFTSKHHPTSSDHPTLKLTS